MVFRALSYPQTLPSRRERRANWVTPCFPSFPAVIDEILNGREWRCCRWLAWKITLYTDTFILMQLLFFFMRQMIPPAWLAAWECKVKCLGEVPFKALLVFGSDGRKKEGKNQAGRQRGRISITGKDLINKNRSITTLWACKMSVNPFMI